MSTISRIAGVTVGLSLVAIAVTLGWAFSTLHRQITTLEPLAVRTKYRGYL
jgi:hypothetical protein